MKNNDEVYHYSQIALQQIEELRRTLNKISTLVDHRSYSDDIVNDATTNLAIMRMKISVVSDITESLTI